MKTRVLHFFLLLCLALPAFAQPFSWTQVASSNGARWEGPSIAVNGKMYVFTGVYTDANNQGKVTFQPICEAYNPATNQWTQNAQMPVGVTHVGHTLVGTDVWFVTGFDAQEVAVNNVQIYHTATNTWSTGPAFPFSRGGGAAVYINGKIHFFGGLQPNRRSGAPEHYALDPNNLAAGWVARAPMPDARNHFSAVALNGKIYAIGGQYNHDGPRTEVTLVDIYDPVTNTWSDGVDLPFPLSHHEPGTFVHNGKIIVVSGGTGGNGNQSVLQFDPATNQWTTLGQLPQQLFSACAEVVGDKLVVSNGGRPTRHNTRKETYITTFGTSTPVNNPPILTSSFSNLSTPAGQLFTFQFPANKFTDADGDVLSYTATLQNGAALPAWLTFNATTRTFSGTPAAANVGTITIKVTASDGAASASGTFNLTVTAAANNPPVLTSSFSNLSAPAGQLFTFQFPANKFTDADGDVLSYTATLQNGAALPAWLTFNATTRTFSGTPAAANVGTITIKVTASDGSASASGTFNLTVTSNTPAPCALKIESLTLMHIGTAGEIRTLQNSDTINLNTLNAFSVRANPCSTDVKSVKFFVNGSLFRTESSLPFAIAGDNPTGKYNKWNVGVGTYTVSVTPYSGTGGNGTAGTAKTITLTIINQSGPAADCNGVVGGTAFIDGCGVCSGGNTGHAANSDKDQCGVCFGNNASKDCNGVCSGTAFIDNCGTCVGGNTGKTPCTPSGIAVTSLTLVSASTHQDIRTLVNGDVIDYALTGNKISIRANTNPNPVGSVRFGVDGVANFQLENGAPYTLKGDNGGKYNAWTPAPGSHTVTATPYSGKNATGTVGTPLTITFTVINSSAKMGEEDAVSEMTIYPNPSNGIFTVNLPSSNEPAKVFVYNALGEEVLSFQNPNEESSARLIDLSQHSKGIYFVRVLTADKIIVKKVIVE